jgi:hypothetical protein
MIAVNGKVSQHHNTIHDITIVMSNTMAAPSFFMHFFGQTRHSINPILIQISSLDIFQLPSGNRTWLAGKPSIEFDDFPNELNLHS